MNKTEILTVVNEVFKDFFDDETLNISLETTADDIAGWDSLAHITLMSAITERLDIEFDIDDLLQFSDIGTLVQKAEQLLNA